MTRLAAVALILAAWPAFAQAPLIPRCAERTVMLDNLSNGYGEVQVVEGLAVGGNLIVMTGNTKNGTWTMFSVGPDGTACIALVGHAMELELQGIPG